MGKFDNLLKFLGHAVEDVGDDAAKALSKVDNAKLATELKGAPRREYLNALDEIYGDQAKRAKDLHFSLDPEDTKYLETNRNINSGKGLRPVGEPHRTSTISNQSLNEPSRGEYLLGKKQNQIDKAQTALRRAEQDGVDNSFQVGRQKQLLDDSLGIDEKLKEIRRHQIDGPKGLDAKWQDLSGQLSDTNSSLRKMDWRDLNAVGAKEETVARKDQIKQEMMDLKDLINRESNSKGQTIYPVTTKEGTWTDGVGNIRQGQDVRSTNAAFDPRFKDSGLLMAGGLAGSQLPDMSPLPYLKEGANTYNKIKNALIKPTANSMNFGNDPIFQKVTEGVLGLTADPLNFVDGPIGLGLGAAQMLGDEDKNEKAKRNALKKLAGE